MDYYKSKDLEKIYNSNYFDKSINRNNSVEIGKHKKDSKSNFIIDSAIFYIQERLSIDLVIKEFTFSFIALFTYLFMQHTGRISSLNGFGSLVGYVLIAAVFYNLYKASFKSLTPGLLCLFGGLILLEGNICQHFFKFLSKENIEYIIGIGALFMALSLFKTTEHNY